MRTPGKLKSPGDYAFVNANFVSPDISEGIHQYSVILHRIQLGKHPHTAENQNVRRIQHIYRDRFDNSFRPGR